MLHHRLFPVLAVAALLVPACERSGDERTTVAVDPADRSDEPTVPGSMPGAATDPNRPSPTPGTAMESEPGAPPSGHQTAPPVGDPMGSDRPAGMAERPMGMDEHPTGMAERPMGMDEPPAGDRPPSGQGEGMDADVEQRIMAAQQRYDQLEQQYEMIKRQLEAKGDDAATKTMNSLEQVRLEAKNKLEAARAATADTASEAVQELDSALEKLDKKLADQPRT